MAADNRPTTERSRESGVSLFIMAVAMIFILGMAGLAIDLASLYVGRSEAQRAADAAALAGAQALVTDNCLPGTSGATLTSTCEADARLNAEAVGNKNLIAGINPNITDADITFPNETTTDPQVRVVAGAVMPTFFVRIFGKAFDSAAVSAVATAEAYNPSGSTATIGSSCVKPWLFPNCDQFNPTTTTESLTDCVQSSGAVGPFVEPDASGGFEVARPENYPTGALYEPFTIKPGFVSGAAAPGQFYAAYLPNNTSIPQICPACGKDTLNGGVGSGALYETNIECCNTSELYCGQPLYVDNTAQTSVNSTPGDKVGPTGQAVDCLINQNGNNCDQDYINSSDLEAENGGTPEAISDPCSDPSKNQGAASLPEIKTFPPLIMPGAGNLQFPSGKTAISWADSSSVIVAPIYNGLIGPGQNTVYIAGFVQLFIRDYDQAQQGTVYAYVLSISGCGSGGLTTPGTGGNNGTVTSSYGTAVPVRLIH